MTHLARCVILRQNPELFHFCVCLLVAINATVNTMRFVCATEEGRELLLGFADATGIFARKTLNGFAHTRNVGLILFIQKLQNERHTDISAVCRLLEIARSGIFVNLNGDFVDTGQRVHYAKILLRIFQLIGSQNIAVLETEIF